jgi:hypothetical protein
MNIMRQLFISWHYLETSNENYERRQTIVIAGEKDFSTITRLMQQAGMPERVLGRVENRDIVSTTALGHIGQLAGIIRKYSVKEIIFCENGLSYKEIINSISGTKTGVRNKFHASGSSSIVGSDSKNDSGDYVASTKIYNIAKPINRRNKRLFDVVLAGIFILGFPVFIFLQKRPAGFYKNVFKVLAGKKTWVGYATEENDLPPIKKSVISSTSLPIKLNGLPNESLLKSDEWYATGYSALLDLKKISRGFKYLYY